MVLSGSGFDSRSKLESDSGYGSRYESWSIYGCESESRSGSESDSGSMSRSESWSVSQSESKSESSFGSGSGSGSRPGYVSSITGLSGSSILQGS
ncbi:unnamed protein product [Prunus armeniaca]